MYVERTDEVLPLRVTQAKQNTATSGPGGFQGVVTLKPDSFNPQDNAVRWAQDDFWFVDAETKAQRM